MAMKQHGKRGRTKAVPFEQVLAAIRDEARPLGISSLRRLSDMPTADDAAFRAVWADLSTGRRRQIMEQLVEVLESNFEVDYEPLLRLGLQDIDPEVRIAAAAGLWDNEDAAMVPLLLNLLATDPDPRARAAVARALGHYVLLAELGKLPESLGERMHARLLSVIDRGERESPEVRRRAIEALSFSSHERVAALITEAYASPDEGMRACAVFAMGRSADDRWAPVVRQELDSNSREIRYEATRSAGELEMGEAVPRLIELAEDEDEDLDIQLAAIWALGEIGGQAARAALERILDGPDDWLRKAAEDALHTLMLMGDALELPLMEFDADDAD